MKKSKIILGLAVFFISLPMMFAGNGPARNPYLSAEVYGVSHFNPGQTDAFPYNVSTGTFNVDLSKLTPIYGGPINIMCLSAAVPGYMWVPATDRITYVDARNGAWKAVASMQYPGVPNRSGLAGFYNTTYTNLQQVEAAAKKYFGNEPQSVTYNGLYTLADKDNIVYFNTGTIIYAVGLKDNADPSKGLEIKRQMDFKTVLPQSEIPGMGNVGVKLIGINMTYDGYLVVGSAAGFVVIDREFKMKPQTYLVPAGQLVTNSLTVDENNGIYIASGSLTPKSDGVLSKVIWKNGKLSTDEKDGAWSATYDGGDWPPAIKAGTGTGSTPTLFGFAPNEDKLVVLTNGQNRMKLVAFWRDGIPSDFKQKAGIKSRRIADQWQITAGLPSSTQWVQSEQSVVAGNDGVFVVNNVIPNGDPDKLIDVMANGPIIAPPMGVEKVNWDNKIHSWVQGWTRADVSSTSMVPALSLGSNIVFVSGWNKGEGWVVTGMDWATGKTVHKTIFGNTNYGNGAYAIMQFAENGDMLYNSIAGPYRIQLKK